MLVQTSDPSELLHFDTSMKNAKNENFPVSGDYREKNVKICEFGKWHTIPDNGIRTKSKAPTHKNEEHGEQLQAKMIVEDQNISCHTSMIIY